MKSALFSVLFAVISASAASAFRWPVRDPSYNWTVISKDVATTSVGISFLNATHGYLPSGKDGVGAEILTTDNGGKNWTSVSKQGFLLLDVSSFGSHAVVSGVFSGQYSNDYGAHFNYSKGGAQSQCVRNVNYLGSNGPSGFGVAGPVGNSSGISLSFDGGKSFNGTEIGALKTNARYASFPTGNDFYVTAGEWPENDNSRVLQLSSFAGIYNGPRNQFPFLKPYTSFSSNATYKGQILVSHDGGKSFNSVFYEDSDFYMNGIDCTSAKDCCAVGEAPRGPKPGSRIYCTHDGGSSWDRVLFQEGGQHSLLDIQFAGDNEYWAVGGVLQGVSATSQFLHSTDGGKSWNVHSGPDGYALSVDCLDGNHCWSPLVHQITQSVSIASLQVSE
eukprot:gb/GECG01003728.1/.p1 GENE.gb/GECG01003728.1/~~gb/GECG01003728.1/.p1  ORF type:complete len:389 (+),score=33.67 gb/GECG01003728.1/:1-1167(+)